MACVTWGELSANPALVANSWDVQLTVDIAKQLAGGVRKTADLGVDARKGLKGFLKSLHDSIKMDATRLFMQEASLKPPNDRPVRQESSLLWRACRWAAILDRDSRVNRSNVANFVRALSKDPAEALAEVIALYEDGYFLARGVSHEKVMRDFRTSLRAKPNSITARRTLRILALLADSNSASRIQARLVTAGLLHPGEPVLPLIDKVRRSLVWTLVRALREYFD